VRVASHRPLLAVALAVAAVLARAAAAAPQDAPPPAPAAADAKAPEPECKVEVVTKGEGREAKKGDFVLAHLVISLPAGGKTLVDTHPGGDPQVLQVGNPSGLEGLDRTVAKMRQGDRWKVSVPWQLAWGEKGYPPLIPAKSDALIDIEVTGFIEIKSEALTSGAGPVPQPGEYVAIHYLGEVSGGKPFADTRKDGVPFVFSMGSGQVIAGWELTLRTMKVGDRVKLTVPWQFAFGVAGRQGVPPRTDVAFDLERVPLPGIPTEVIREGKGAACAPGRAVTVHYTGTFTDGKQFDSSRDRGQPYTFVLGARQVIPGWELAVARMRAGDRWKITVPSALAYGAAGKTGIPAKSDLVFDIEVLDVK
jgi:peptidylprolyl isomerase